MSSDEIVGHVLRLMDLAPFTPTGKAGAVQYVDKLLKARELRPEHHGRDGGEVLTADAGPDGGDVVAFVSHVDVLRPSTADQLRPWHDEHGVLWGRGAAKTLGATVAAVDALSALAEQDRRRFRLVVGTDGEEEPPSAVARYMRLHGAEVAFAITAEPGPGIAVETMGRLSLAIELGGTEADSARPDDGRNAIEVAEAFWAALRHLPFVSKSPNSGLAAIAQRTGVYGSGHPGVVPAFCRLTATVHLVPGQDSADVLSQITTLGGTLGGYFAVDVLSYARAATVDRLDPYVQRLAAAARRRGQAGFTTRRGHSYLAGCDVASVAFGAGVGQHGPYEQVRITELRRLADTLVDFGMSLGA